MKRPEPNDIDQFGGESGDEKVVAALRRLDPTLTDVPRARVLARVWGVVNEGDALAEQPQVPRPSGVSSLASRTRQAWGWTVGSAAAVAILLSWPSRVPVDRPLAIEEPAPTRSGATQEPPAIDSSASEPIALFLAGRSATTATARGVLASAPGGVQRARFALGGELALGDSGRLEVVAHEPKQVILRLSQGRLAMHYENRTGKTLVIETNDARVVVIGTTFVVDSSSGHSTRVSVIEGKVRVDVNGVGARIDAGESLVVGHRGRKAPVGARARESFSWIEGAKALPVAERPAERVPFAKATSPSAVPEAPAGNPRERFEGLYRRAEDAMKQKLPGEARLLLNAALASDPTSPEADAALFDLVRLSAASGDLEGTTRDAERLVADRPLSPFAAPARFIACRTSFERAPPETARACLRAYLRDHPGSAHDADALALLVVIASRLGDCSDARKQATLYLTRHPSGAFAADAARSAAATCESL